ncbi:pilus assembly protein TadG-related protein [Aurantiacibacter sp. MUD11]|uniref:Tad domain-containing protein n=1 Tax=Aurantiacibacter sp. MUD11 TaxID=3003265 RepID=UPI0022AAEA49|nr:Tad domain-containing protein [Aurantiacibacter sp. MUD11]WAT18420.1 pilus assembly protein TadG-related protein [Aurantiacibacter sp. MUD11]
MAGYVSALIPSLREPASRFLKRLARNSAGNVAAMLAAALFPLLALIGGGVDMGRGYLAHSRLQQACDAGVLAARQRLGSSVAVDGVVPEDVAATGQRFFNINFRNGVYGTENRAFQMTLEENFAISGEARVDVPTTLMQVFGHETMDIVVDCEAILNFSDLDVMMVLDVTGSMRRRNPGDSLSRLDSVKAVIRRFHAQIEASKAAGTEIRYGFVPYAANVNVGGLLRDEWMVDSWTYQGREDTGVTIPNEELGRTYTRNWRYVSGQRSNWTTVSTYAATWVESSSVDSSGYYRCAGGQPQNQWSYTESETGDPRQEVQGDPEAVLFITPMERVMNGTRYRTTRSGTTCQVQAQTDTNYVQTYEQVREVPNFDRPMWLYTPVTRDVSNWRSEVGGCIEERDTYQITDYANVDFSRALDLDIDLVPQAGNPSTQWRPRYPDEIYIRRIETNGSGDFDTRDHRTTKEYVAPGNYWFSDCPPAARKLDEMDADELDSYLATLHANGATYHDIGMIWGGRLISPTGIFASENADPATGARSRHLIWMTDGQTEPYDLSYGTYGVDGLDQRRWDPDDSSITLTETIENRFSVACDQVKNRNVTVWVVAFGTSLTDLMTQCAGEGHYFQASNAAELNAAFEAIARSISELRISN